MKTHTKAFKEAYSFSRELQILTDLHQKSMSVPRIVTANAEALSITLIDAGTPINLFLKLNQVDRTRLAYLMQECLEIASKIFESGVLHLDLAPRNFLVEPASKCVYKSTDKVTLIDFSVTISRHFPLQKPLWLRPNSVIHHPTLIAALMADWSDFFKAVNQQLPPNFEENFSINPSDYGSYWSTDFKVERMDSNNVVLCFGLYNCLQELLRCWNCSEGELKIFQKVLLPLKLAESNSRAVHALEECRMNLKALMNDSSEVTPIPRLSCSTTPIPEFSSPGAEYRYSQKDAQNETKAHSALTGGERTGPRNQLLKAAIIATPPLLSFYMLDTAYRVLGITLTTTAFFGILFSLATFFLLCLFSLRRKTSRTTIGTLLFCTNFGQLPLVSAVISADISSHAQIVTCLPIILSAGSGLLVYRQSYLTAHSGGRNLFF